MADTRIRRIVIVGGGIPGWLAALTLSKLVAGHGAVQVVETRDSAPPLLESWEGCLPPLKAMHRLLGIDERVFMRTTQATFHLATQWRGWNGPHSTYIEPLGDLGAALDGVAFHHHWLRVTQGVGDIAEFSLGAAAARLGRFVHPSPDPRSVLSTLDYAYHFDAQRYADSLRTLGQERGVKTATAAVAQVQRREADGFIDAIVLDSGERLEADLFIDCSGPQARLIGQELNVGYADWSQWLPCDRIVTLDTQRTADPAPLASVTAREAGWQWCLPLQHRDGNGYAYASRFVSDDAALTQLRSALPGAAVGEPSVYRIANGRREKFWAANCIALGATAGFMEPLHATSLHLIHSALSRLAALFPHRDDMSGASMEYNRLTSGEYERIRDMIALHYHLASANPAAFWQDRARQPLPEPAQHKLRVFRSNGRVVLYDEETFPESQWVSALLGHAVRPAHPDALAQTLPLPRVAEQLRRMKLAIDQAAQAMPTQATLIRHHCAADRP